MKLARYSFYDTRNRTEFLGTGETVALADFKFQNPCQCLTCAK